MPDDSTLDLELARSVLRQGELRLDAQIRIMQAIDQRGLTLAALLTTLSVATAGAALTLIFGPAPAYPPGLGLAASATVLTWTAWKCVMAAAGRENRISLPGNDPQCWWDDAPERRPLAECLRREADNYQDYLEKNRERMQQQAREIRDAALGACLTPAAGLIAAVLTAAVEAASDAAGAV